MILGPFSPTKLEKNLKYLFPAAVNEKLDTNYPSLETFLHKNRIHFTRLLIYFREEYESRLIINPNKSHKIDQLVVLGRDLAQRLQNPHVTLKQNEKRGFSMTIYIMSLLIALLVACTTYQTAVLMLTEKTGLEVNYERKKSWRQ